jgi:hypothetical protein
MPPPPFQAGPIGSFQSVPVFEAPPPPGGPEPFAPGIPLGQIGSAQSLPVFGSVAESDLLAKEYSVSDYDDSADAARRAESSSTDSYESAKPAPAPVPVSAFTFDDDTPSRPPEPVSVVTLSTHDIDPQKQRTLMETLQKIPPPDTRLNLVFTGNPAFQEPEPPDDAVSQMNQYYGFEAIFRRFQQEGTPGPS